MNAPRTPDCSHRSFLVLPSSDPTVLPISRVSARDRGPLALLPSLLTGTRAAERAGPRYAFWTQGLF